MTAQASKSTHPLLIIAGIAVILFCAVGIAAVVGWIPTTIGKSAEGQPVAQADKLPSPAQPGATAEKTATAKPHTEHVRSAAAKPRSEPMRVASNATAKSVCAECGVIETVREVEKPGEGSVLGTVGGAVVGGVLGNQVGSGRGRDVMTVVGAVGGAVAGNQIEKKVKTTKSYEITVRFEDGSARVVTESNPPTWRPGDKVRVVDGQIRPNA